MRTIKLSRIKQVLQPFLFKDFVKYMHGQTIMKDLNGDELIFEDDFMRWLLKLPCVD